MADRRPVVVGAPLSLTGRFAEQGRQAARGLELWAETVKRAGGLRLPPPVGRRSVVLHLHDDEGRRSQAAALTERLINDERVDLLLSPYASMLALAAAEVAAQSGRVLWNHGGSSDAIASRRLPRIVNLLTPASRYAEPVLRWATARAGAQGVGGPGLALVSDPAGTFAPAVAAGARAEAARLGVPVVVDRPYPADDDGWTELLTTIRKAAPAVVFGAGTIGHDLAFARRLALPGAASPVVSLVAAAVEAFADALGPAVERFCGPSQWEPSLPTRAAIGPSAGAFVAAFRARFGREPDYPAAQAYAAAVLAAHCLERVGPADDAALWEVARSLDTTTLFGAFRLDPESGQQLGHQPVAVQWRGGRKVVVWPPPVAGSGRGARPTTGRRAP